MTEIERGDRMNDNRIAEIQQQCEKRNTTNPIIFKNNLAKVDVVRALMEEIASCNEDVTYLLAQLAERDKEIERLRKEVASLGYRVPVVRCEECSNKEEHSYYCLLHSIFVRSDFFCKDGGCDK
jgi:Tfp pilus assembly protein PilO